MDQPIIPPAQEEDLLREAEAADGLNAEDILEEFSAQAEGEALQGGEEEELPSVDNILNEFSAPEGETPAEAPDEGGSPLSFTLTDKDGVEHAFPLPRENPDYLTTSAVIRDLVPEEAETPEEILGDDTLPVPQVSDEVQTDDLGNPLTISTEDALRAIAPEAESPDIPEPQPEPALSDDAVQPDAPAAEEAEELNVDDILREFSTVEDAASEDAPPAAEAIDEEPAADDLPQDEPLPSDDTMQIDGILPDFDAALTEKADAAAEQPDPLEQAEELPDLFPAEYYGETADEPEEEEYEYEEPTVVERPAQKKKSTARKVLRVFAVIGKYLIALVIAALIAVAGLFIYLTLTEYNPAHAEIAQPGAVSITKKLDTQSFTILTMNTGYAALGEDADFFMDGGTGVRGESEEQVRDNMLGIEAIVRSADADFVFLQELDTDSDRSFELNQWLQYEHDLEDYESRFALNYSCDYVPYPIPETIGKVHSGIATFSRYDISSATRYSLPCPFSWPTRIANLKRCMLVTRIPLDKSDGKELVLVNFHLEAYDDGEGKTAQTEQLMDYLLAEYEKGNYVIAGGDFNQCFPGTQDAYPLKDTSGWAAGQLELLPDGWKYAYDDAVPTCRLLNQPYDPSSPLTQYYVIDGFIVSPNLTVKSVQTLNDGFVYSDHNPVLMEITLNQ